MTKVLLTRGAAMDPRRGGDVLAAAVLVLCCAMGDAMAVPEYFFLTPAGTPVRGPHPPREAECPL